VETLHQRRINLFLQFGFEGGQKCYVNSVRTSLSDISFFRQHKKIKKEKQKMKKITTLLLLLAISILFADTVIFSEEPDASAENIQGKVWIWDSNTQQYYPAGSDENVYVYLYFDQQNGGGIFDSECVQTNSNSFYSHNFLDYGGNSNYCDLVKVCYEGKWYQSVYDGIVRIDIYYHPDTHTE